MYASFWVDSQYPVDRSGIQDDESLQYDCILLPWLIRYRCSFIVVDYIWDIDHKSISVGSSVAFCLAKQLGTYAIHFASGEGQRFTLAEI